MRHGIHKAGIALMLVLMQLGPGAAHSSGLYGDLKFLPRNQFSEADEALFRQTLDQVLEQGADGDAVAWRSAESDAGGTIKPLKTLERDGMRCRQVEMENAAGGNTNTLRSTWCKTADGSWKVAPK